MNNLILENSFAKRSFKKRIGNANHLLITILVGLDEIELGKVRKSSRFSTSWNPKDSIASAKRSSRFALNSALSWVVDNLDSYFILAHRKPSIIESEDLSNALSGAGQSVSQKMDTFERYLSKAKIKDEEKYSALVALGIQWRNNTTHFDANNILEKRYRSVLKDGRNKEWFFNTFQGLDIDDSLRRFDAGDNPSFKEVTAIVRATHIFVDMLDNYLLSFVNIRRIAKETINRHYSDPKKKKGYVLNYNLERKMSMIKMILLSRGFTETQKKHGSNVLVLNPGDVENILNEAIKKYK